MGISLPTHMNSDTPTEQTRRGIGGEYEKHPVMLGYSNVLAGEILENISVFPGSNLHTFFFPLLHTLDHEVGASLGLGQDRDR